MHVDVQYRLIIELFFIISMGGLHKIAMFKLNNRHREHDMKILNMQLNLG